jgi:hypothetical protein
MLCTGLSSCIINYYISWTPDIIYIHITQNCNLSSDIRLYLKAIDCDRFQLLIYTLTTYGPKLDFLHVRYSRWRYRRPSVILLCLNWRYELHVLKYVIRIRLLSLARKETEFMYSRIYVY